MENAIKQICFLLFAIWLIFILADCNVIGGAYSQKYITCEKDFSDSSNQSENSHSICFEDVLYINHIMVSSTEIAYKTLLHRASGFNFLNTFSTSIWQPPKHS
jgi:hypothetical protein